MMPLRALLLLLAIAPTGASAGIATRPAAAVTVLSDGIEVRRDRVTLRVTALTDAILRVRIGRGGAMPEDASWAVPAAVRHQSVAVATAPEGFTTGALIVHIDPATLALRVTDRAGNVVSQDSDRPLTLSDRGFTLRKAMPLAEHYFGLGDKTGGLDRRGKSFVDWNTDAYGFTSADDPIYKSIPFFIGVGGAGGSYGVFLDNTWRSWFDFGHREADVVALGADEGPIDYYLIAGPSTAQVVRRFTDLTGKAPLPPKWALGYQQSRWSYMSADELKTVAARLRQERVPTDVLWLDIDYQDRNRPFTVDTQTFPDMRGLISGLGKDGFKVVTITDLHVAYLPGQDYPPYRSGAAIDAFVHRADGKPFVGPVWPGPSVFPDFTDARIRAWWGGLFKQEVEDGVAGSWNDMNEPAVFDTPTKTMPLDNVHRIASDDFAPRTALHREIHNVYGMQNTRGTYDGLKALRPDERAFVMTRASYAGGQRYAVTWTGDNSATWDHLKLSIQQIINLGLSGFSWSAADVSGFTGGPSPDLLTRWFEIGAFYPIFRDHSAKGNPRVEPWVDGPQHLAIRRHYVEERYRLMPYLYALADRNARAGDPVLRPVFYDYPSALTMSCDQSWAFTLGRSLLVAPPPHPESPQAYKVCLPAGGWYDYWTGRRAGSPIAVSDAQLTSPGDELTETPQLDHLPVFVRAGTILPRQSVTQSTVETPAGPLMLDVYPGPDCHGELYADDGHSMAFERGDYLRQTVRCRMSASGMSVSFEARQGRFQPSWHRIAITIHDWQGGASATAQGRSISAQADAANGTATAIVADQPAAATIDFVRR